MKMIMDLFALLIGFSFLADPGSPAVSTTSYIWLSNYNNDAHKSLEPAGIWVRINNMMSVIGCKRDTSSRQCVCLFSKAFQTVKRFQNVTEVTAKSLRNQTRIN